MRQYFVKKNSSKLLNLVFLGYGQDGAVFSKLFEGLDISDTALVCDYTDTALDESGFSGYNEVNLIAWSMGVMMAPRIMSDDLKRKIIKACAINGTLEGIDDNYGIPVAMWDATIDNLSEKSVLKFYRRMCGDAAVYEEYISLQPKRSVDSLRAELEYLKKLSLDKAVPSFKYDKTFIGSKDKIIAPQNQIKSCEHRNCPYEEGNFPHYDATTFIKLLK